MKSRSNRYIIIVVACLLALFSCLCFVGCDKTSESPENGRYTGSTQLMGLTIDFDLTLKNGKFSLTTAEYAGSEFHDSNNETSYSGKYTLNDNKLTFDNDGNKFFPFDSTADYSVTSKSSTIKIYYMMTYQVTLKKR